MEKIIEVYGKEIETKQGKKFIVGQTKNNNKDYIDVRLVKDAGNIKLVKGYQKIKFDTVDSNVKYNKQIKDGKEYKRIILYIQKAEVVPYTDDEKQAMNEKQEQAVIDLFK